MSPVNIRPTLPSSDELAKRMVDGATAAQQKYVDGALNPRRSAKGEALKANARYKAKMQEVLAGDLWLKGIEGINEDQMMAVIQSIGGTAYVQGIQARQVTIKAAFDQLVPLLTSLINKVRAMPAATDADREARMLANMRGLKDIGKQLRGK